MHSGFASLPKLGLRVGSPKMLLPLLRVLSSLTGRNRLNMARRAFFCSDASDGSDQVVEVEAKAAGSEGEAEAKASSAIVSTHPRPEDYLTVLALPLPHRPLFPGFYMSIYVKDPKLLAALQESRKRQAPYAGAFFVKDEPGTDPSLVSGSDAEKSIHELKGKDLFNRLHEVGMLAQVSSFAHSSGNI